VRRAHADFCFGLQAEYLVCLAQRVQILETHLSFSLFLFCHFVWAKGLTFVEVTADDYVSFSFSRIYFPILLRQED
jgi:hypothetical protein